MRLGVAAVIVVGALVAVPVVVPRAHAEVASSSAPQLRGPADLVGPPIRPEGVATSGGQSRLLVTTSDPAAAPNHGLRTNLTEYYAFGLAPASSFQVAASEVIGAYEAVFGFFQNDQTFPTPFFTVFSNTTDSTVHLVYWTNLTLVGGASYDFALATSVGTNWTLTVNGEEFDDNASAATFDFGSSVATWGGGVTFSEVALFSQITSAPPQLEIPLAFATLGTTGWYLPHAATATSSSTDLGIGVAGRDQNSTLAPGELATGTTVPGIPNGTSLWTGGPVPVDVAVTVPSSSIVGTVIGHATVTVTDTAFAPIPGVAVYLSDSVGSVFLPDQVITDGHGSGLGTYTAANVSATTSDRLTATVVLFGFTGVATVPLTVAPSVQLFLTPTPTPLTAVTDRPLAIALTALDGAASPADGVLVEFSVSGGNAQVPAFATTDATGTIPLTLIPPSSPGNVTLRGHVATPGYWGAFAVNISVVRPPPTLSEELAPFVPLFVGLGVGLVATLALRWWARRRRPIPKFALPAESSPGEATLSRRRP